MDRQKETFGMIAEARAGLVPFAMRLTGDRDAAEDLVQEAVLRAMEGCSGFTPGTNLRAWLKKILLHSFINRRAREKVRRRYSERADGQESSGLWLGAMSRGAASGGSQESAVMGSEAARAASSIPVLYAEAVRLVDVEGYRYAEAADELGCPVGTVMSRLHRGRKMLAEALEAA